MTTRPRKTTQSKRTSKSPRQRAEEALGVADRAVAHLRKQRDKHEAEAKRYDVELDAAKRRRDYLASSPDLPQNEPPSLDVVSHDDAGGSEGDDEQTGGRAAS